MSSFVCRGRLLVVGRPPRPRREALRPPPWIVPPSPPASGRDDGDRNDGSGGADGRPRRLRGMASTAGIQRRGGRLDALDDRFARCPAPPSCRGLHSTAKREILPFLAAGVLGVTAVYTYRAFQQMDRDWEEYYDALEEYGAAGMDPEERRRGGSGANERSEVADSASSSHVGADDLSRFFTGGTLGIDLGTTRLKVSHRPSLADGSQHKDDEPPGPTIAVDREGFRSTPSLIWVPPSNDEDEPLVGRLAEARSHDARGGTVVRPREALERREGGTVDAEAAVRRSIRAAAANALDQVMGNKGNGSSLRNDNPLFVLDASTATPGSYNVRPIFTHPPHTEHTTGAEDYLQRYREAVNGLTSPSDIAAFVPEPVAVVCGADYHSLLPSKAESVGDLVLVIDVGGASTCVSVVKGDAAGTVIHSTSFPFGGDTFIDLLVSHLVEGFYGTPSNNKNNDINSAESKTASLSSKPTLNDPAALQRLYEASTAAIHELSNKTRSNINIPYLTMDPRTRQPKHLTVGMSRNVVDAEVETWIRTKLVPHLQQANNSTLSRALPPPTDLPTLFSSVIMSALEQKSLTPHALRAVLLVGGGARAPLVQEAARRGVGLLAGEAYANGGRLVAPAGELGEELGVLGAAVWVGGDG